MPTLSTFGAAHATGRRPAYWDTSTQFFAIGGGGAGKLDSIAFPADSSGYGSQGTINAVSYTVNSAGYPGQVASNTQFVPMSSQTLRYRASGTNADGSGPQLNIKSGESYSVIIGAGGINGGAGGSTSLIKSTGSYIVTAAGGAASPGTTAVSSSSLIGPNGSNASSYRPARYETYYDSYWGYWYDVYYPSQYTYMAATYGLGFRPLGSNASVTSASQTVIRNDGNWDYYAYNYFNAQSSYLPHGPIMRANTADRTINGVDGQSTESLIIPMLPSDLRAAGGITPELSLSRPYWNYTQANNNYPATAYYGCFNNYNMGYSYPDYLFASTSGYNSISQIGAGGGYGSGDPAGNTGSFAGLSPGGNGAFVLAYPASLPPLASTTGLAGTESALARQLGMTHSVTGDTQNPKVINKNGVNYRVYLWLSSGSFTV